ncbi:ABC transporter [Thiohalorhabdus denitrificans]|uniref:Iron complex transport system ATP-binding protein n=1 Tax=Thiohalorhabdus denitrificans TaxID=381306 RepID=A0A0P9CQT5_9GAMM|nr:ABC transporter ATP-binding protein [Thiohalorhabdus denitrificans]KPV39060.1 ABC transporter [Thiohalorhabdus denitrificans]SCX78692.1 iron complex transport system ATP-binding protein [Thiohalorhabdus denitrificans]
MSLTAEALTLEQGGTAVVHGVSLGLQPGEVAGILGPNGAGKSTLLRALAGLHTPAQGEARLNGERLHRFRGRDRARELGYLPQAATVHWPLPVERVVALGRLPHLGPWQRLGSEDAYAVDRALAATGVEELRDRPVTQLSGGERARVLLARVLAGEPSILLADEPVAGLDPYHQVHFMELVRDYAHQGRTVALVLHDLNLAARFCDRLFLMDEGELVAQGTPKEVLDPRHLDEVFGIRAVYGEVEGEPYVVPWGRA